METIIAKAMSRARSVKSTSHSRYHPTKGSATRQRHFNDPALESMGVLRKGKNNRETRAAKKDWHRTQQSVIEVRELCCAVVCSI